MSILQSINFYDGKVHYIRNVLFFLWISTFNGSQASIITFYHVGIIFNPPSVQLISQHSMPTMFLCRNGFSFGKLTIISKSLVTL